MSVVAVTGANRGLGLELCRQLLARGDTAIALCRAPTPELEALGCRIVPGIDVTSDDVGETLRKWAAAEGLQLDALVNNSGIMTGIGDLMETGVDLAVVRANYEVNVLGPLKVTQALLPNVKQGGKVLMLSSLMGSIEARGTPAAPGPGFYAYSSSKAAINMMAKSMSLELEPRGIAIRCVHPGVVDTAMTQQYGFPELLRANEATKDLVKTVEQGALGVLAALDDLTLAKTGSFVNSETVCLGEPLAACPW